MGNEEYLKEALKHMCYTTSGAGIFQPEERKLDYIE